MLVQDFIVVIKLLVVQEGVDLDWERVGKHFVQFSEVGVALLELLEMKEVVLDVKFHQDVIGVLELHGQQDFEKRLQDLLRLLRVESKESQEVEEVRHARGLVAVGELNAEVFESLPVAQFELLENVFPEIQKVVFEGLAQVFAVLHEENRNY